MEDDLNHRISILENDARNLKAQLDAEVVLSKRLHDSLEERNRRIAGIEQVLKNAVELTREKIEAVRIIRIDCEKEVARMAQIRALERNALDLSETRIRELIGFLDGIDAGAKKLYASRRWRFSNLGTWLGRLFSFSKNRTIPGYWRIDKFLGDYRAWHTRYLHRKDLKN